MGIHITAQYGRLVHWSLVGERFDTSRNGNGHRRALFVSPPSGRCAHFCDIISAIDLPSCIVPVCVYRQHIISASSLPARTAYRILRGDVLLLLVAVGNYDLLMAYNSTKVPPEFKIRSL